MKRLNKGLLVTSGICGDSGWPFPDLRDASRRNPGRK